MLQNSPRKAKKRTFCNYPRVLSAKKALSFTKCLVVQKNPKLCDEGYKDVRFVIIEKFYRI